MKPKYRNKKCIFTQKNKKKKPYKWKYHSNSTKKKMAKILFSS